jgi:uncharacterized protein with GYD domain
LSGAVKTTTMRAFTESEADELLSSLAQMAEKVA